MTDNFKLALFDLAFGFAPFPMKWWKTLECVLRGTRDLKPMIPAMTALKLPPLRVLTSIAAPLVERPSVPVTTPANSRCRWLRLFVTLTLLGIRTLTLRVRLVLVTLKGLMALLRKLVKPNTLTRRSVVLVLTWERLRRNVTRLDRWRARPRTSLRPDGAGLTMLLVTPLITVRSVDMGACNLRSMPVITLWCTRLVRRSLLVTLPKARVSRLILL